MWIRYFDHVSADLDIVVVRYTLKQGQNLGLAINRRDRDLIKSRSGAAIESF
jgi:hypothetical protein